LNTNKRRNLHITIVLILSSFITAHLFFWILPDVFERWNDQTIDQLFLFRSSLENLRPPYDDTIVHVDLNNTSIQQLSNFYLNRSHHAQVVNNLASMEVSAQLYDFIFAAPSNDEDDTKLKDAAIRAGNVYFGLAFELVKGTPATLTNADNATQLHYLESTKWKVAVEGDASKFYAGVDPLITFPTLASASKGLGCLSLKPDRDGVFRRVPLLVRYQDAFYPSLSLRAICDYLKVPPRDIIIKPGNTIALKGARRPGTTDTDDIVIPIDRNGTMVINFIGSWERMKHYSFADVLRASEEHDEMEIWREELSGKIAIVSEVSTGTSDIGPVPTDSSFPLSGVHANAMHTILTKVFLRELSSLEMLMIEGILLTLVFLLSLRFASLYFSLGTLLLAVSYVGVASASFLYGHVILHIIRPLLMIAFALISLVVYRYIREEREKLEGIRQRDFIRATFGRYLSNEVVEELLESPGGLEMSGETREITLLVSDLRGFTSLSSTLSPREVITILNRYLEPMVEVIARYRGTVDEFQGDGILVFFGAPLAAHDDPERAVACAIEMQNKMVEMNKEQVQHNLPELKMGIGINTGEVVVGNIGSEKRSKYGAVGTAINTTYRIESYTTGGQILISPDTYEKIRSQVRVLQTMKVQFKGIDHPVTLYDVTGIEGNHQVSLVKKESSSFTDLALPLPVNCFLVRDKTVSETGISGYITGLSDAAVVVSLEKWVPQHSNLKIILAPEKTLRLPEAYAKVVSVDQSDTTSTNMRGELEFTSLPEEVKNYFNKKRSG
jgi:class 3 adenylate cyclase/CHASE2 domain-containing sensor protein